jgi:hypothetical protein
MFRRLSGRTTNYHRLDPPIAFDPGLVHRAGDEPRPNVALQKDASAFCFRSYSATESFVKAFNRQDVYAYNQLSDVANANWFGRAAGRLN